MDESDHPYLDELLAKLPEPVAALDDDALDAIGHCVLHAYCRGHTGWPTVEAAAVLAATHQSMRGSLTAQPTVLAPCF